MNITKYGLENFEDLTIEEIANIYASLSLILIKDNTENHERLLLWLMCLNELENVDLSKIITAWETKKVE